MAKAATEGMPLAKAQRYAEKIMAELAPYCDRVEVAGSIRRRKPFVRDVDLVVLASDLVGLKERCKRNAEILADGDQNFQFRLLNGVEVDIWIARRPQQGLFGEEPTNWGAILLTRTGSKEHNIWLVLEAERRGFSWNPYRGLLSDSKCVACQSEEEIFSALGLEFIPPEHRERG